MNLPPLPSSLPPLKPLAAVEEKAPLPLPKVQGLPKLEKKKTKVQGLPKLKSPSKQKGKKKRVKKEEPKELDHKSWRNGLKNFLKTKMLNRVVKNKEFLDKLVSDQAMDIWEVAFTHESYNPNVGENYEELELFGDRVMGVNFLKYMMKRFPKITRSQLSELRTNYLAKAFQSRMSHSLGLGEWVRTRFRKNTHVLEDVLESFFGALDLVGDKVFKFGAGNGLAYNMVKSLFKDVKIDFELTKGNPKTRVKEMFQVLGWINTQAGESVPETVIENEDGTVTFTVSFNPTAMQFLRQYRIPVLTPTIAMATENTKKTASVKAYEEAVAKLSEMGIDEEFVQKVRTERDSQNPQLAALIVQTRNKTQLEGYEEFYLNTYHVKSKKTGRKTEKYVQLIGVDTKGRKTVLQMTKDPVEDVVAGKVQVMEDYLR